MKLLLLIASLALTTAYRHGIIGQYLIDEFDTTKSIAFNIVNPFQVNYRYIGYTNQPFLQNNNFLSDNYLRNFSFDLYTIVKQENCIVINNNSFIEVIGINCDTETAQIVIYNNTQNCDFFSRFDLNVTTGSVIQIGWFIEITVQCRKNYNIIEDFVDINMLSGNGPLVELILSYQNSHPIIESVFFSGAKVANIIKFAYVDNQCYTSNYTQTSISGNINCSTRAMNYTYYNTSSNCSGSFFPIQGINSEDVSISSEFKKYYTAYCLSDQIIEESAGLSTTAIALISVFSSVSFLAFIFFVL